MKLDLKELLAKITGQTEFRTLLWTNPNPTTTFAAQTILSASQIANYDAFEVKVKNYITGTIYNTIKVFKDTPCPVWCFDTSAFANNTGYVAFTNRAINITSSGFAFAGGYNKTLNSSAAGGASNNVCVPIKVYGIKYVGG